MSFEYWFMLPVAILVATTAMASGVGGATFFAPIFILALRLPPEVAVGTGLLTELFGFASGLYAYSRKKLIDYSLGIALLLAAMPLAIIGSLISGAINPAVLKIILAAGLIAIAITFIRSPGHEEVARLDEEVVEVETEDEQTSCLTTAEGETICYKVCNKVEGLLAAGIGGLFLGLISSGLGELNGYYLLRRCRVPSKVAVATSVFVVALTALIGAVSHLFQFMQADDGALQTVFNIAIFTIPGVIIGAQLGSRVASHIPQKTLERSLGGLFILIALALIGEGVL